MLNEIRVYFEGDTLLRPGFAAFFRELQDRAKAKGLRFRLISARGTSPQDFATAHKANPNAWNILLKDSEEPDTGDLSASLCDDNVWDRSLADSIFWMVEMMESWFHADKDALAEFYGNRFNRGALKRNPKVEKISKKDLKAGLKAATKDTAKGDYYENKTSHGPRILERINPRLVREAAPNCQKFFTAVLGKLS